MYRKRYVNAVAEHDTKGSPLLTYSAVGTKEGSGDGSGVQRHSTGCV